jgi:molybdopterin molybdotransferase
MISVQEAQQHILSHFEKLGTNYVPLRAALGRRLTQSIYSNINLPLFDNSSVDGFALQAEDISDATTNNPICLHVAADIPAGSFPNISISKGQAARIMTGAPLPDGADAVVMLENTDSEQHLDHCALPFEVKVFRTVSRDENVRKRGTDIISGQEVLPTGKKIGPQEIGILAMLGCTSVPVRKRPKIAIISSGNELIPIDAPLVPGKIYDSNTPMLTAMAEKAGCDVFPMGVALDHLDSVQNIFQRAASTQPDLIISSAGVGPGAFDYIKDAVKSSGSLNFWKVNMRPGKPLAFGNFCDIPFFGLPGNPVSSYINFLVFVQPVLELLAGTKKTKKHLKKVYLAESIESDGRESYLRAVIKKENGTERATLTGHQGSANLFSLVKANSLIIIPAGVKFCPADSKVDAWVLES